MKRNTEVEITLPLRNPDAVSKRCVSIAKSGRNTHQKDTYYVPPHRNFLEEHPITDWLRIRETDRGASVNFKHWHNTATKKQAVSCDEYETAVGDAEMLKRIFSQLQVREIVTVEKRRTTWLYRDVEIAIDDVAGLGWFIELEAKGDFATIDDATDRIDEVLKELDAETGPQDYKGYPHLLLEKAGYDLS